MMRLFIILSATLLCIHAAPFHIKSRQRRAAEQVIFGNHQNNARVKKSGPDVATPLEPLSPHLQEAELDKKALVGSEVKSTEPASQKASQEASDTSQEGQEHNVGQEVGQEQGQEVKESSEEPVNEVTEDSEERNLEKLLDKENTVITDEQMSQQDFPMEMYGKNQIEPGLLAPEYLDYPQYDYQYNPYLRRKRSLKPAAVAAEDMMAGPVAARRSKRDLGQDVRYLLDYQYPEMERRSEPDYDNAIDDEEGVSEAEMEQLLRQEMEEREMEQEGEAPYMEQPAMPEQEAEDMALINYLYRNGYGDEAEQYEEAENEVEPWQDMGPAPEMRLPQAPYYPYGQFDAPYALAKRQYLSFVPGSKRSSDFYPYAYGPDGRWSAMVADEVPEKRAEEEMYERLLRLAAALRDRRDELEAERYYAGLPDK